MIMAPIPPVPVLELYVAVPPLAPVRVAVINDTPGGMVNDVVPPEYMNDCDVDIKLL